MDNIERNALLLIINKNKDFILECEDLIDITNKEIKEQGIKLEEWNWNILKEEGEMTENNHRQLLLYNCKRTIKDKKAQIEEMEEILKK